MKVIEGALVGKEECEGGRGVRRAALWHWF